MWSEEVPKKAGMYIVQTKSNVFKTVRTMDAKLTFNKGKAVWSFSNQSFYRVLI